MGQNEHAVEGREAVVEAEEERVASEQERPLDRAAKYSGDGLSYLSVQEGHRRGSELGSSATRLQNLQKREKPAFS